ncbi:MAG: hypothetical protein AB1757_28260 [Acidobacteriota bacterium]
MRKIFTLPELYLALVLVVASFLYIYSISPNSFGYYHDDSIYVVTAKALATGQGYRIISLPNEPVQTKSPPLHPLLLSLIWRINPDFPTNLVLMMNMSVLFAIFSLVIVWIYLTGLGYATKWRALIIIGLTALNWRTIVLSCGIYTEMVYSAISITGLYLAEKYEKNEISRFNGIFVGIVIGLTSLTRSPGIALIGTVGALFFYHKKFLQAGIPLIIANIFIVSWVVWGYLNMPTFAGVNTAYFESYLQTLGNVIDDVQHQTGYPVILILIKIVVKNAIGLLAAIPLVCIGASKEYIMHFGFAAVFVIVSFCQTFKKEIRFLHFYILFYLGLHLIWPYRAYDRFLMPLLPFLLLFFIQGIETLTLLVHKELTLGKTTLNKLIAFFLGVMLISILIVGFVNYSKGIGGSLRSSNKLSSSVLEDSESIRWIKNHTEVSDVLVCYHDPLYFMYTGRKATRSTPLKEGGNLVSTNVSETEIGQALFRIIRENHARYLILSSTDFEFENDGELYRTTYRKLIEQNQETFVRVFQTTDERCEIYKIIEETK